MTIVGSLPILRQANNFRLLGRAFFVHNEWIVNEGEPNIDVGHGIGGMGLPQQRRMNFTRHGPK